jgi:hypothetical protein
MSGIDITQYQQQVTASSAQRDVGLRRVEEHADPAWIDDAYAAIVLTARGLEEFISDDVWNFTGLPWPREARALGPVFRRAQSANVIEKTGRYRKSVHSNMTEKPIWRSLIFGTP